jgi:hypothetical protein
LGCSYKALFVFLPDNLVEQEVNTSISKGLSEWFVTKEEALELFTDNPFKVEILITKVPDGT